jgi:acyl-CoA dehydrogenase
MVGFSCFLAFLFIFGVLAYQRASLIIWSLSLGLFLIFATKFNGFTLGVGFTWLILLAVLTPLNVASWRRRFISQRLLNFYRSVMPTMSRTEKQAISAGTVTWEGDLFRGNPDWNKLLAQAPAKLTAEEKAFIDGPVETLCTMLNDWDITHNRVDLPPEVWQFIKDNGFFGLIIPKQYGGKEFSAYAHSQILVKIGGVSITAGSSIAVPNSLGPAELLLHYGTPEQKNYYLPRLAKGEEIPCFALTSPVAGSDAGAMTDHGIVCWGEHNGEKTLGIRLSFEKRYITLAPIATVIGLAFKMYDPDQLLGNKQDIGITCALIPRNTAGIHIGRRHFALNCAFQNGPISGKNIFIPIDWIIGGPENAGKGWRMLMECLAAGRAISLPASATAGGKVLCYAAGAYARIRKQFNMSIGKFEGVEEPLARIAAFSYILEAARTFTTAAVDAGEKPSVASAIIKYHSTELGRRMACDGMDIHGGKGICLGPNNYLGRGYEATPIAITVEGANILTRNMIIFGQGVMRCHPYILPELEAAKLSDPQASLIAFDKVVMKHIAFGISNTVRSFVLGLTSSYIVKAPKGKMHRYYQQATRFASAFALISDVCMMVYGGSLKRKESISARLGDILSYLYLLSAVLKYYQDQGENVEDLPVVRYACLFCLHEIQESFDGILKNFPLRLLAFLLRILIFPLGKHFSKPKDFIAHKIAQLLIAPTATRDRLSDGAYLSPGNGNLMADMQDALIKTIASEPIEKAVKAAKKDGLIEGYTALEQAQSALQNKIISEQDFDIFMQAEQARKKVISVDDFSNEELERVTAQDPYANYQYKAV